MASWITNTITQGYDSVTSASHSGSEKIDGRSSRSEEHDDDDNDQPAVSTSETLTGDNHEEKSTRNLDSIENQDEIFYYLLTMPLNELEWEDFKSRY